MTGPNSIIPEPWARWSNRTALLAAALLVITLLLHRLFAFPTSVALNMFAVSVAGAAIAIVMAVVAIARIWARGRAGAWSAAGGMIIGSLILLWPLSQLPAYRALPRINDITTDWIAPPRYAALVRGRNDGSNKATYPGEAVARLQIAAYPDIRPMVVDRSVDEIYDVVLETLRGRRGLGWKVVAEEPPTVKPAKAGVIEAT